MIKFITFKQLPFILQFIWNPFMALDLTDDDDYPDHNKVLPTLAIVGVLVCAVTGHALGAVIAIGVMAASFGFPMFKAFLESKQYSASARENVNTFKTVIEQLVDEHKQDTGA